MVTIMPDPEVTNILLALEQEQNARIKDLQAKVDAVEDQVVGLTHKLDLLLSRQNEHDASINAFNTVLNGALAVRGLVIGFTVLVSAVTGVVAALEWFKTYWR
jgi:hypothetical protein